MSIESTMSDEQKIESLVHRYAAALDRRDFESILECFTEDGEFVVSGEARLDESATSSDIAYGPGRANIAPLIESTAVRFKIVSHLVGQSIIEVDGESARAETYGMSFGVPLDGPKLAFRGVRYLDDLQRHDGEWRIRCRKLTLDWSAEAALTYAQDFADRVGR